jgi:hypothetical protein
MTWYKFKVLVAIEFGLLIYFPRYSKHGVLVRIKCTFLKNYEPTWDVQNNVKEVHDFQVLS